MLLLIINNSFGQLRTTPYIEGSDMVGVTTTEWRVGSLPQVPWNRVMEALKQSNYTAGNYFFPIMGYDPQDKKLKPLTMIIKKRLSDEALSGQELGIIFKCLLT